MHLLPVNEKIIPQLTFRENVFGCYYRAKNFLLCDKANCAWWYIGFVPQAI